MGEKIPDQPYQEANAEVWGETLQFIVHDPVRAAERAAEPHMINPNAWLQDEDPEPKPAEQAQPSQEGEQ